MMSFLQEEPQEERLAISTELPALIRRHRNLLLVVFLAAVFSTYVTLQLMTELYECQASVLVKLGRENAEVPATVEKGGVFTTGVRKEEIYSEIQMLSSPSLIAAVVDRLGPEAFKFAPPPPQSILQAVKYYVKKTVRWVKQQGRSFLIAVNLKKKLTDRENAILAIQQALNVEREKDSDVIRVHLRLPDGNLSVRVLDALLLLYRDEHVRVRRNIEVKEIFETQIRLRKQQLKEIEDRREKLRAQFQLSSVSDQRTLLLRQFQDLNNQMAADASEKATLLAQQGLMRARLNALPDETKSSQTVTPNPTIQSIKERIGKLQEERARVTSRYTPESQVLKNLDEEIATLKGVLTREEATMVASVTSQANPVKQSFLQSIEQFDVKIAGLNANLAELQRLSTGVREQLRMLDAGEHQLELVERERKIAEENYLTYTKRGEEAYISDELDRSRIANISILTPPASSIEPVYPPKLLVMGLSLPVGLLLGVILALILEYLGDRINAPSGRADIEGISFLGTITLPASANRQELEHTRERKKASLIDRVQERFARHR